MGILDNLRRAVTRTGQTMSQFIRPSYSSPPTRNTEEWLRTYGKSPRFAAVTKIATDLSIAEGRLVIVERNGNQTELDDHPFLDFWRNPNPLPEMSAAALWRLMELYLYIKGEAAAVIERGGDGMPVALWPVPPHWILEIPYAGHPYYRIRSSDGQQRMIPAKDMFIQKELNPLDPYRRGLGPMEQVAAEIQTDEYMVQQALYYFYNHAMPDILLTAPGAKKEEVDRLKASWRDEFSGVANAYRMGVLPAKDIGVHKLSDSAREMDFIESRRFQSNAINQHSGVPPEIMGITENSNRATATQAKIIYAENVLMPRLLARQEAINQQLLRPFGRELMWVYDDIVPEDQEFRLQTVNEGASRGVLLINEWREAMGYDPIEGGDALTTPFSVIITSPHDLATQSARQTVPEKTPAAAEAATLTEMDKPTAPESLDETAQEVLVAQEVSLNGAQIASLLQIVQAVNLGELARGSAIEIILSSFPFDRARAEAIVGEEPITPPPAIKSETKSKKRPSQRMERAADAADRILEAQERAAQPVIERFFRHQLEAVTSAMRGNAKADEPAWLAALRSRISSEVTDDNTLAEISSALGGLLDWNAQATKLEGILRPIWTSAFDVGAKAVEKDFGLHAISKPELTTHMLEQGFTRIDEINSTTRDELARTIAKGIQSGESAGQLAARVQQHMPDIQEGRARVIALTEAHTSLNAGRIEQMKLAGVREMMWMTRGDNKVRATHQLMHGETAPLGERFSNGLRFPGDPAGAPGEIINCRCSVTPADFK